MNTAHAADSVHISKRIPQIDLIKVFACVMVVLMHACRKVDESVSSYYVLYYLTRAAIPLFLMVNGYLQLYGKEITWKYAVKKTDTMLLIGVAYAAILETAFNIAHLAGGGTFNIASYKGCLSWVLQRGNNSTLWYLAALAILTLMLPVLSRIFKKGNASLYITIALVAICACIHFAGLPSLLKNGALPEAKIPQTLRLWNWLAYYFIGGTIRKYRDRMPSSAVFPIAATAVLSAASVWYMNYMLRVKSSVVNGEFMYDCPLIILWAASIFVLLLKCPVPAKTGSRLAAVSSGTLVVYLLHYRMLLPLAALLTRACLPQGGLVTVLCVAAIAAGISGAIYALLRRTPGLRVLTHI